MDQEFIHTTYDANAKSDGQIMHSIRDLPGDYYVQVTYTITINRADHTLTLFKNGQVYKVYPVAVGKPTTPTPAGTFRIVNKLNNPGGPYGARWLGLSAPHVGIHGTNNPASIGNSVSHGCIRMHNNNVIELSRLVPIGTMVKII